MAVSPPSATVVRADMQLDDQPELDLMKEDGKEVNPADLEWPLLRTGS